MNKLAPKVIIRDSLEDIEMSYLATIDSRETYKEVKNKIMEHIKKMRDNKPYHNFDYNKIARY